MAATKTPGIYSDTNSEGVTTFRVRFRKPDGKYSDKRGFETITKAKAWKRANVVSVDTGKWVSPRDARTTVGELWPTYVASLRVKPSTMAGREYAWHQDKRPERSVSHRWADKPIGSILPSHVTTWIGDLVALGVKPASIQAALLVLRGILAIAVKDRLLTSNPCEGVEAPRRVGTDRHYLTHSQLSALAGQLTGRDATIVRVLGLTGLRWGELSALRVQDVDMLRRRLNVTRAFAEVHGKLILGTPKTHQVRSVPFPRFLADELSVLMVGKSRDALVFTGERSQVTGEPAPLAVSRWRPRVFDKALARCRAADPDFPEPTVHDLRHTAASLAIASGANVKDVQRMLGHASAAMTLDTYAGLFDDGLDDVADRLDAAARVAAAR